MLYFHDASAAPFGLVCSQSVFLSSLTLSSVLKKSFLYWEPCFLFLCAVRSTIVVLWGPKSLAVVINSINLNLRICCVSYVLKFCPLAVTPELNWFFTRRALCTSKRYLLAVGDPYSPNLSHWQYQMFSNIENQTGDLFFCQMTRCTHFSGSITWETLEQWQRHQIYLKRSVSILSKNRRNNVMSCSPQITNWTLSSIMFGSLESFWEQRITVSQPWLSSRTYESNVPTEGRV